MQRRGVILAAKIFSSFDIDKLMRLNTLQQQIASYCHHYLADLHVGKLPIEFTLHKLAKKSISLCNLQLLVVILVVLTEREFRFSLFISQLLAKAIPVRGARFRKSRLRQLKRDFCFYHCAQ